MRFLTPKHTFYDYIFFLRSFFNDLNHCARIEMHAIVCESWQNVCCCLPSTVKYKQPPACLMHVSVVVCFLFVTLKSSKSTYFFKLRSRTKTKVYKKFIKIFLVFFSFLLLFFKRNGNKHETQTKENTIKTIILQIHTLKKRINRNIEFYR